MSFVKFISLCVYLFCIINCNTRQQSQTFSQSTEIIEESRLKTGAEREVEYLPLLRGKKVGVVLNQTSFRGGEHMLDYLLSQNVNVTKIFALEHGIRGTADAGEVIIDGIDSKSGLPIVSLYGSNKKPSKLQMSEIDVVLFDIQDVGVRFYTYISSLDYMMQACIENEKLLLLLDRPNPHANYVDGPVLDLSLKSFVGMHKVPVVYGLTIGEYAKMIDGEGWHNINGKCNLIVVPCENYDRSVPYELPIKPSPNLPNHQSIMLYPSLCLFEGTQVSVGRGTDKQFQQIGMPGLEQTFTYNFTPMPNEGAKEPLHKGKTCYGLDLSYGDLSSLIKEGEITYQYIIEMYNACRKANLEFFNSNNFFDKLAGNTNIRKMIIEGKNNDDIRASYKDELKEYLKIREKYLLY